MEKGWNYTRVSAVIQTLCMRNEYIIFIIDHFQLMQVQIVFIRGVSIPKVRQKMQHNLITRRTYTLRMEIKDGRLGLGSFTFFRQGKLREFVKKKIREFYICGFNIILYNLETYTNCCFYVQIFQCCVCIYYFTRKPLQHSLYDLYVEESAKDQNEKVRRIFHK